MHISLNILIYVLSSCKIDFTVSSGNSFIKLPLLIVSLMLFARSWAIVRGVYIAKAM